MKNPFILLITLFTTSSCVDYAPSPNQSSKQDLAKRASVAFEAWFVNLPTNEPSYNQNIEDMSKTALETKECDVGALLFLSKFWECSSNKVPQEKGKRLNGPSDTSVFRACETEAGGSYKKENNKCVMVFM